VGQDGMSLSDEVLRSVVELAARDGELSLHAAGWSGSLRLRSGTDSWLLTVIEGGVEGPTADDGRPDSLDDITVAGGREMWANLLQAVPPPPFTDPFGAVFVGMQVTGGPLDPSRHLAVRRLSELARHAANGTDPTPSPSPNRRRHGQHDAAVGRYIHLDLEGLDHRLYYEAAGSGIGLLCQHTAGADGRQWRHLLEDPRITSRYQVVVYDLPYHGRSLPPESRAWWAEPYLLTRSFAMAVPNTLAAALGLKRPVFIGSSVGGMLALDLARFHADNYRAVIACEAALHIQAGSPQGPKLSAEVQKQMARQAEASAMADPAGHAAAMMSWMGATAPEASRQETRLHYAQGAPGVFPGDIHYFGTEHDLRGQGHMIDTDRCEVHLLTGEYDFVTVPASQNAAAEIPGATFEVMSGLGHFPMSEDPERFIQYVLPILDAIADRADRGINA
jgi:pimeloyl-ACP methyl ester carboxylesterase